MVKVALPLVALVAVIAFFALTNKTTPVPEQTEATTPHVVEPRLQPKSSTAPAIPPSLLTPQGLPFEPMGPWNAIETQHSQREEADPEWRERSEKLLTTYFGTVNDKLERDEEWKRFQAKLLDVDCRKGSCKTTLEFEDFGAAMAYVEMLKEGRLRYEFNATLDFECPLKRTAIPIVPGRENQRMAVLLLFECER